MKSESPDNIDFNQLMEKVREGCADAKEEVFKRFEDHVKRSIRRHLNRRLRKQYDSIDFSQAVWGSFFQIPELPDFDCPEKLIAYLTAISRNKVIDECRKRLRTQQHNINAEESLTKFNKGKENFAGPSPTPSAIVVAKETAAKIMKLEPSYNKILRLRAKGATFAEIAKVTGFTERSLRRVLKRIESRTK